MRAKIRALIAGATGAARDLPDGMVPRAHDGTTGALTGALQTTIG